MMISLEILVLYNATAHTPTYFCSVMMERVSGIRDVAPSCVLKPRERIKIRLEGLELRAPEQRRKSKEVRHSFEKMTTIM
jgi:hypothetical protein